MSKHQIQPACGERARWDGRTYLAGPNSRERTGTRKSSFSLFSRPRAGLATLLRVLPNLPPESCCCCLAFVIIDAEHYIRYT